MLVLIPPNSQSAQPCHHKHDWSLHQVIEGIRESRLPYHFTVAMDNKSTFAYAFSIIQIKIDVQLALIIVEPVFFVKSEVRFSEKILSMRHMARMSKG